MNHHKRVRPWLTLPIALGNAIQIAGLAASFVLARQAGRRGPNGNGLLLTSRMLAYFTEHAFAHWLVGRLLGIHFTGYGLHGSSHAHLYPPIMRQLFAHLPFLSVRIEPHSRRNASPAARAAMYCAGPIATIALSVAIPLYGLRRGVPNARAMLIGFNLWNVAMVLGELLRPHGDFRRALAAIRD